MLKYSGCLIIFLTILSTGCKDKSGKEIDQNVAVIENEEMPGYSEKFKQIIPSDSALIRGTNFSMSRAQVKASENSTFLGDSTKTLAYEVDFNPFESCDVIYYFESDDLRKIELNFYMKSKGSADSLITEFKKYFSEKFSPGSVNPDSSHTWQGELENIDVLMKSKNEENLYGFQILLNEKNPSLSSQ
jgi:hypothetical protein